MKYLIILLIACSLHGQVDSTEIRIKQGLDRTALALLVTAVVMQVGDTSEFRKGASYYSLFMAGVVFVENRVFWIQERKRKAGK